ncbi:hemolysin family protein [Brevibacillus dissolubilis]|uniref:hemolysin family protein n=1 Tax=Brevibacillus dissolubilis TaxID=1844116 RepID=UPI0021000778|nr:hemolysin family protein [Brevibacillus dissolubilis]
MINLTLVAILIAATAFFVAAEFAVIRVRSTKIAQLASEGNTSAQAAQRVLANLDGYLSACQLGITITALGLGALGEPTVEHLLHPLFEEFGLSEAVATTLSFIIAFASVTFLHVVVGELAPKTVAIQKAEQITLLLSKPLLFFYKIMYPFIWALNGSAGWIIRMMGLKPAKEHDVAHSEEELRIILSESLESGEINKTEYTYVNNIFEFDERIAREIMVPRTEMVCLYTDLTLKENFEIMKKEGYTRFPVVQGDKDHIIGMVNMKEMFIKYADNKDLKLEDFIRPVLFLTDSIPIKTVLSRMQKERAGLAVLIDEYGGTAGILTMEDILEEIVGEIRDEFDTDELAPVQKVSEDHYSVDGKVLIRDLEELLDIHIETDADTVAGWLSIELVELIPGKSRDHDGWTFTLKEIEGLRLTRIHITKKSSA